MKKTHARNIYVGLLLLLLLVIVWMCSKNWFCEYKFSNSVDPLALISLIISTGVAVYLGHTITKGLSEERFDKEYIIKDLNSLDDTLTLFTIYIQNAKEIDINECSDKIEDIRMGISKFKHSVDIFQVPINNLNQIDKVFEKIKEMLTQVYTDISEKGIDTVITKQNLKKLYKEYCG